MNRPLPHRLLPLPLAIALTVGSTAAQALGLGGITVKSELNEPLRAEIPVFVAGPDETKTLEANLAAAEEFARVGLSIGAMSVPINFDIVRNARGEPVIEVTSEQPVREPFLSFILEVNWANGRLLREYSILLDPPVSAPAVIGSMAAVERLPEPEATPAQPLEPVAEAPSEPMAEPEPIAEVPPEPIAEPVSEPASEPLAETPPETVAEQPVEEAPASELTSEPVPEYLTQGAGEEPEATAEPEPEPMSEPEPVAMAPEESEPAAEPMSESEAEPAPEASAASEYGPVASGETLWEIATTTRPNEAVTLNQMMLALLRANPDAFYQDNINNLKRGAILRIPGPEEIEATRAAQAAAEVLNQNRTWIESTRPTMIADGSSSSGFAPGTGIGSDSAASSRLELVPPASGGISGADRAGTSSGSANAASAAELARTKEALNSIQSEASELRERVKELEGLSGKSERLIELKDSELKAMQDRLAAAEKKAAESAAALAAAQGDAAAARRIAEEAETAARLAEEQRQAQERAAAEAAAQTPAPVTESVDTTPAPGTDMPATEPSTDPMASAEPLDTSAPDATVAAEDTAVTELPATDTTAQPAEVVPLAEAEPVDTTPPPVQTEPAPAAKAWYQNPYILGGGGLLIVALGALGLISRKRKAADKVPEPRSSLAHNFIGGAVGGAKAVGGDSVETDLLNALAIDPTDLNAHLNVLEYFYTRRDPEKFEAAAEAMHAQVTDPNAAEWQGALLMGADICPTHPLFASMNADAGVSSNLHDPFASGGFDSKKPPAAPPKDFGFPRVDAPTPKATPAVPAETFDFDLVMDKNTTAKKPSDELSLDFDLDLDAGSPAKSVKIDKPSLELPNLDFGAPAKAAAMETTQQMAALTPDFLGDDAVATKIDLARAYLDMGDSDGARSMLEEVMTEGNAGQRDEAKKLLSEIR